MLKIPIIRQPLPQELKFRSFQILQDLFMKKKQ